jgi:hypothetical protein
LGKFHQRWVESTESIAAPKPFDLRSQHIDEILLLRIVFAARHSVALNGVWPLFMLRNSVRAFISESVSRAGLPFRGFGFKAAIPPMSACPTRNISAAELHGVLHAVPNTREIKSSENYDH